MDRYIDVMRRTIELSDTCIEGIEHIQKKIYNGVFEETTILFWDIVNAIYHMEKSVTLFSSYLPANELEYLSTSLRDTLELMVSAYENHNWIKMRELIQFSFSPSYNNWKEELESMVYPYILM